MSALEGMTAEEIHDARMTVLEHLSELRQRVIYAFIAFGIAAAVSWVWAEPLFEYLLMPLRQAAPDAEMAQMHHMDLAEPFFVLLKTSLFSGAFIAAPVVLYQIYAFIAPGLYDHEKKAAIPFLILATAFFVAGASFCFFLVMPLGYEFLLKFSEGVSSPELRINEYLALTSKLLLGFGAIFELPVFAMFLARIGVITHHTLLAYWRYSVVASFVIAAMLTPPDIVTQSMMAGPLIVLYFISIGVAWYFTKQRERREAKEAAKMA
jgi:sec-independent protein translocase protein TatC